MNTEKQICFKCQRAIKGKSYSGTANGIQWFCCSQCLRKQERGIFENNE